MLCYAALRCVMPSMHVSSAVPCLQRGEEMRAGTSESSCHACCTVQHAGRAVLWRPLPHHACMHALLHVAVQDPATLLPAIGGQELASLLGPPDCQRCYADIVDITPAFVSGGGGSSAAQQGQQGEGACEDPEGKKQLVVVSARPLHPLERAVVGMGYLSSLLIRVCNNVFDEASPWQQTTFPALMRLR